MANVNSTQQNIPVAGIKDGIILLKDGGYRVILSVAALNYSLKSEQEQNALIFQYQSFLNSLHFPIQIVMQSKKLDLAPYIKKIKDISEKQTNELLKNQTTDYIDFVGQLVNMANIMKKSFYVVVPYQPLISHNGSLIDKILKRQESPTLKISEAEYNRYKDELLERAGVVASGLGSMGLHCVQLDTEQIIELLYKIYNPDVYSKERISNAEELTNPIIASQTNTQGQKNVPEGEKETLIDNSSIVKERQKQEFQQKQREEEKNAEKFGGTQVNNQAQSVSNNSSSASQPSSGPSQPPVPGQTTQAQEGIQQGQQDNNFGI